MGRLGEGENASNSRVTYDHLCEHGCVSCNLLPPHLVSVKVRHPRGNPPEDRKVKAVP